MVISQSQDEVAGVFRDKANELEAPIFFADETYIIEQAAENRFNVIEEHKVLHEGLLSDLKGVYQQYNYPGVLKI